jgi:hypothetical protein
MFIILFLDSEIFSIYYPTELRIEDVYIKYNNDRDLLGLMVANEQKF